MIIDIEKKLDELTEFPGFGANEEAVFSSIQAALQQERACPEELAKQGIDVIKKIVEGWFLRGVTLGIHCAGEALLVGLGGDIKDLDDAEE